jgi:type II secretory pathway pseudopilin PulG
MEEEMPDILLGVIIGGLIASVTPIVMIILDHRRWQRQSALEQLRFERKRLEKIFRGNLKRFSKAITENSYPSDMIMDFILTMPKEVSSKFKEFLADPNKTDAKCKKAYFNVVSSMKKTLSDIDSKIENIISQKPKFFKIPPKK